MSVGKIDALGEQPVTNATYYTNFIFPFLPKISKMADIHADLIARLIPYLNEEIKSYFTNEDHKHSVSEEVADHFIESNEQLIRDCAIDLVQSFEEDDMLDDLNHPQLDWFRECIYVDGSPLYEAMLTIRPAYDSDDEEEV